MRPVRHHLVLSLTLCLCGSAGAAQHKEDLTLLPIATLQQRADTGDAAAADEVGNRYYSGRGVPQNRFTAATWYWKAEDRNDSYAENILGEMCQYGRGIAVDPARAAVLYRKAADQGNAASQLSLAAMYRDGIGMTADPAAARLWFQKAAAQGNQQAKQELAKLATPPAVPARVPSAKKPPPAQPSQDLSRARGLQMETASPAAAAAVAAVTAASIPIPHNYALIFATDDYAHWPHLANPISDADAVNQTLTSLYGFHVEEVKDATDDQILQKLTEYLHRKFEPQDQLLIFFSGHGYFDPDLGKGFLVPANALRVQDDIGHRSLLAHETIMDYVNRIPAKHVVLVIDACFAGTLDRKIADSGLRGDPSDIYVHATLPELLERKELKRTRRYITSGGKDFVPDGLPGHHSPFISAFLVTLNQAADRKGYATLDDIQEGLNTVNPEPRWGDIQDDNDPGADFLLLTPTAIKQLNKPN